LPGVEEKVQGGYVIKTEPGFPLQISSDLDNEPWTQDRRKPQYLTLQAQEGDYSIFIRKSAIEIKFEGKKYLSGTFYCLSKKSDWGIWERNPRKTVPRSSAPQSHPLSTGFIKCTYP